MSLKQLTIRDMLKRKDPSSDTVKEEPTLKAITTNISITKNISIPKNRENNMNNLYFINSLF